MRWLCTMLVLAGCVQSRELTSPERAAVHATLQAWRDVGMPEPRESCDFAGTVVRTPDAETFERDCRKSAAVPGGCLILGAAGAFGRRDVPIVVISPAWHSESGILTHELCHALLLCAGLDPDRSHSDPRIWKDAEPRDARGTSVQRRAMDALQ